MDVAKIEEGMSIRTHERLGSTAGMMVHRSYLDARRAGEKGKLLTWVPGHGGDLWLIEHEDGRRAVYCYMEFFVEGAWTNKGSK